MAEEKPQKKETSLDDQTPEPASKSQNKGLKIVLIVIAILVVLGLIGTLALGFFGAKIGEKVVEEATNSEIDTSNGNVNIQSSDGDSQTSIQAGDNVEFPDDFPAAVPVYEPHSLMSSSSYGSSDQKVWALSFTTESTLDEVHDFYESELANNGWETQSTASRSETRSLSATNEDENLRVQLSVRDNDGETSFNLNTTRTESQ
ncbi:MAG: hypothetical protein U5L95_04180 [Candidatus Saccharibacteria bacterium]|nr:hypothetical protein [Candidatus Saccharibacteria bacterium]